MSSNFQLPLAVLLKNAASHNKIHANGIVENGVTIALWILHPLSTQNHVVMPYDALTPENRRAVVAGEGGCDSLAAGPFAGTAA